MTLPSKLLYEVCSVISDTGYFGSADEYCQQFYGKDARELTTCEAEMIIRHLKPGCLANEEKVEPESKDNPTTGDTWLENI